MDTLLRFGAGNELYEFDPAMQIDLVDNFRETVQQATRVPGASGGVNEYGLASAPRNIGQVNATFWLLSNDADPPDMQAMQMQTLKSMIGKITSFGTKRLYKQPADSSLPPLYCEADAVNVAYAEAARDQPHKRLRVNVSFQVMTPFWFSQGTEAPAWGDGTNWGAGPAWGGTAPLYNASGTQTDLTVTTLGNTETYPRVVVRCNASQTAQNIRIQRIVNGSAVDQLTYAGTLNNSDRLVINARAQTVTKNGLSHYTSDFQHSTAGWFKLMPGDNAIKVLLDNSSDACGIEFRYYEAYT